MIKGERVYLCEVHPANNNWLRNQRNDPAIRKYLRAWKDISEDQQESWYRERGNNSNPNHVYFEIHMSASTTHDKASKVQLSSGQIIGCTGLHYIDWRLGSAEFSIFLMPQAQGAGLGRDALITLFNYGFREMNLHKIKAEVFDGNKALPMYTDILGMTVDGISRHSQFRDGTYINSTMLSILEHEWFSKHGPR